MIASKWSLIILGFIALSTACCGCLIIFIHVRAQIMDRYIAEQRYWNIPTD
jgi:hypothetical protein